MQARGCAAGEPGRWRRVWRQLPDTPEWNFVFVNHVTTNPFFVPTQYGIEDAEALLGTTSQWTGSEKSVVSEMVDAMNTAISGNADGIAVSVVDPVAFNDPIQKALDNGIPVIAYNANGKGPGRTRRSRTWVRTSSSRASRWASGSSASSTRGLWRSL